MMMDTDLVTLAQSGAATLVGLMVTDGWAEAKITFARLLGRGVADSAELERLERSRIQVVAAAASDDRDEISDVEIEWEVSLRRLLRADPAAVEQLRKLVHSQAGARDIYNINHGDVRSGSVIQAGYISGDVFGTGTKPDDV